MVSLRDKRIRKAGQDGYSAVTTANLKRHAGNPILSPKGQGRDDETFVSQGAIVKENGLWYSLYYYRTAKQILPGVRLATSPDGKGWTKMPGHDLLGAAPEQKYIEWHQVYKYGERYVMLYEGYNGGIRWGADVAIHEGGNQVVALGCDPVLSAAKRSR